MFPLRLKGAVHRCDLSPVLYECGAFWKRSCDFTKDIEIHSESNMWSYIYIYIYIGNFKTTADRLICEQTLIHKFKTH